MGKTPRVGKMMEEPVQDERNRLNLPQERPWGLGSSPAEPVCRKPMVMGSLARDLALEAGGEPISNPFFVT